MNNMEVLLVFDIGKTNKKVLLFDRKLRLVQEKETRFPETVDDEGFPCDDAHLLEKWIREMLHHFLSSESYEVRELISPPMGPPWFTWISMGNALLPYTTI